MSGISSWGFDLAFAYKFWVYFGLLPAQQRGFKALEFLILPSIKMA
jgi:hypothetical protein